MLVDSSLDSLFSSEDDSSSSSSSEDLTASATKEVRCSKVVQKTVKTGQADLQASYCESQMFPPTDNEASLWINLRPLTPALRKGSL